MKKISLIVVLLWCAFNSAYSQIKYNPQYADSCYLRGINDFNEHNYQEAKVHFKLSYEINDSIQREEPYLSSNASDWVAYILYIEGKKNEAHDICANYCFLPVDQRYTLQSDSLWVLASKCSDLNQSLLFAIEAKNVEIANLGPNHYYIANSDQEIASLYMQLEQWDSAKHYQEEAISIFEKNMNVDYSQSYIVTLLEYIRTCVHLSDYTCYKKTMSKCKVAAKQLYGENSDTYAYTLYEIARANIFFKDFVDCIDNANKSVATYSLSLPSEEIELQMVLCYQLLGNAYGSVNNYFEAKTNLQRAYNIMGKRIGDTILFDIAYYQGKCGEYDNAIKMYQQLIDLLREYYLTNPKVDKKHTQRLLISCYLDIADMYYSQKDISNCIEYAERGLSLAKEYDFPSKQLEALQALSVCDFEKSLYSKAIELQEYILEKDSNNMTNMYNLMMSYYATKNKKFYTCANRYYSFEKEIILSTFSGLYEKNRSMYLENGNFERFSLPARFARYYKDDDSICGLAYDCELFRKGLLLTSSIEFSRMITECDETTQKDYHFLQQIRERLNHPISDQEKNELYEEEQRLEGNLLKLLPLWAEKITQLQFSWKDVRNALKKNEIAIEFAEEKTSSDSKMIALVIRNGWNSPKCVVLDDFECNIRSKELLNSAFSNCMLSNIVWNKIITECQIENHETIYFAADGVLRVFPIEYLPDFNNPKQTISERFDIIRLSSTREVCSPAKKESILSISLYGNLLYDVPKEQKIANSGEYTPSQYCTIDNERSVFLRDSIRSGYKYLYWTKAEIDSIENYAINYSPKTSVVKYELDKGTEESFKALSKRSTSIVHLSTHAFYQNPSSIKDYYKSEGLLLSGCNTVCDDSLNVEDGILCASEIELLDFRNTSLVVLSACNTGLGNSMVDGIGGLQRAFKKAGVSTLIMSLWEVSDIATSFFMQQFYKSLFLTKSKRKAFIEALQLTKKEFEDPYLWASFVMLD